VSPFCPLPTCPPFPYTTLFRSFPVPGLSVLILLACAGGALSQTNVTVGTPGELKRLSLEELLNIEVTSVSRRPEKLSETASAIRSEEHTSELQSRSDLVCRLLL